MVIGVSLGQLREKFDAFFDVRFVCINSGQSPQSGLLAVLTEKTNDGIRESKSDDIGGGRPKDGDGQGPLPTHPGHRGNNDVSKDRHLPNVLGWGAASGPLLSDHGCNDRRRHPSVRDVKGTWLPFITMKFQSWATIQFLIDSSKI